MEARKNPFLFDITNEPKMPYFSVVVALLNTITGHLAFTRLRDPSYGCGAS